MKGLRRFQHDLSRVTFALISFGLLSAYAALPPQFQPNKPEVGTEMPPFAVKLDNLFGQFNGKPILSVWLTKPGLELDLARILSDAKSLCGNKNKHLRAFLILLEKPDGESKTNEEYWNMKALFGRKGIKVFTLPRNSSLVTQYNLDKTDLNMVIAVDKNGKVIKIASGLTKNFKPMPGPYSGDIEAIAKIADELCKNP